MTIEKIEKKARVRRVVHHRTGSGFRMSGDHPSLHVIVVVGTILTGLSSFVISFNSLLAVAVWQQTPHEINFLTALEIDLPVIVFGVATMIFKYREQRAAMIFTRILSLFATAVSAGANFLHTVSLGGLETYEGWIGACFNALAPVLVYCCTEILGALLTRPKTKNTPLVRARAENAKLRAEIKELKKKPRHIARDTPPPVTNVTNVVAPITGEVATP